MRRLLGVELVPDQLTSFAEEGVVDIEAPISASIQIVYDVHADTERAAAVVDTDRVLGEAMPLQHVERSNPRLAESHARKIGAEGGVGVGMQEARFLDLREVVAELL